MFKVPQDGDCKRKKHFKAKSQVLNDHGFNLFDMGDEFLQVKLAKNEDSKEGS